jgi:hypothetical protein
LLRSPTPLPLSPRIIYVTSSQGKPKFLPNPPSSDKQLLTAVESYGASKYIGSIVTSHLDWEFSQNSDKKKVRMLRLDPGVVHTGMFAQWLPFFMEWMMVVVFYIVSLRERRVRGVCRTSWLTPTSVFLQARWSGSRLHVITPENSALGLTCLTLAPDSILEPACPPVNSTEAPSEEQEADESDTTPLIRGASNDPAPNMYLSQCWRTGRPFVGLSYVQDWGTYGSGQEGGDGFVAECNRVYQEWKAKQRKGTDDVALKREAQTKGTGTGIKTG